MEVDNNPANKCLTQLLSCLTLVFPNFMKAPANQAAYHDPADPATVRGHNP